MTGAELAARGAAVLAAAADDRPDDLALLLDDLGPRELHALVTVFADQVAGLLVRSFGDPAEAVSALREAITEALSTEDGDRP